VDFYISPCLILYLRGMQYVASMIGVCNRYSNSDQYQACFIGVIETVEEVVQAVQQCYQG
jgi:hypothetical protein